MCTTYAGGCDQGPSRVRDGSPKAVEGFGSLHWHPCASHVQALNLQVQAFSLQSLQGARALLVQNKCRARPDWVFGVFPLSRRGEWVVHNTPSSWPHCQDDGIVYALGDQVVT